MNKKREKKVLLAVTPDRAAALELAQVIPANHYQLYIYHKYTFF